MTSISGHMRIVMRSALYPVSQSPWGDAGNEWSFLFAGGKAGFVIDPNAAMLFQDSAGTTAVTADNDPVGLAVDQSPNDNNFLQATSGNRPTYNVSGDYTFLTGDGSNDAIAGESFAWAAGSAFFCFAISGAAQSETFFSEGRSSSNTPMYSLGAGGTSNNRLTIFVRNDGGSILVNNEETTTPIFDGSPHVVSIMDTGSSFRVWIDGAEDAGSPFSYIRSGDLTLNKATLFALGRSSNSYHFTGDFYGAAGRAGTVSDAVRQQVEAMMALRCGVTLS